MTFKAKSLLFLALSLLLVSSTLALSSRREEDQRHRELQQCKEQCHQQPHYDQGMVRRCESQCEQEQQQREQGRDEEGSNPQRQDPERRLEQCKQQCRQQSQQRRWQCEQECQQEYEQERRRGEGRDDETNPRRQDPERHLEQCKQQCRDQGPQRRWQCEQECQQEYEQERRRDEANPRRQDPERRLEQCKQQCRQQGQQRRWQCEQECQQEYEQERRRGEGRDDETNPHRQDPERRLEQCKQQCRQQGQQRRRQCEQECQQEYEQERRRGEGRDDETNPRRQDPERSLEQCKQQCRGQGPERHWQCEQECQQEYEQERRRDEANPRRQDPERRLEQCKQQCREQGPQRRLQCEQECQQEYEQERRRDEANPRRQDPERRLEQCQQQCRQQGQQRRRQCEQECQQEYEQERRHGEERDDINPRRESEQEERTGRNPYVFQQESFRHLVRTEHGNIRILQNFAQKSRLLLGIANYRLAMLEADPNTFVVPSHSDSESLCYVVSGEGTVTLIKGNQDRESHNIRQGDIIKASAGTIVYVINKSNNQRLHIAKLLQPVSTPGQLERWFTVGGQEPESYYRVFSTEILEAALNTRRDQLERLFGQQRQGVIVKASQEQIRSMSRHSSSEHGRWPFGGRESSGTFNLFNKRPTIANQHGSLHEADRDDYHPLRDLNVQVSVVNITGGSMMVPFYNSKATKIIVVTSGRGYFEMACPHLASQQGHWGEREEEEQQHQQGRYQKVRSQVSRNTVFVVPAGHPVAIVASREQTLQVVCFGVNAEGNRITFVAGRDNIVSKMEREAKELAFGVPSKLVDEVFGRGQEEGFVRGPESSEREEEEEERRRPLESILDFVGF